MDYNCPSMDYFNGLPLPFDGLPLPFNGLPLPFDGIPLTFDKLPLLHFLDAKDATAAAAAALIPPPIPPPIMTFGDGPCPACSDPIAGTFPVPDVPPAAPPYPLDPLC